MTKGAQIENCWPLHQRDALVYFCLSWLASRAFMLLYSCEHTSMVPPGFVWAQAGLAQNWPGAGQWDCAGPWD